MLQCRTASCSVPVAATAINQPRVGWIAHSNRMNTQLLRQHRTVPPLSNCGTKQYRTVCLAATPPGSGMPKADAKKSRSMATVDPEAARLHVSALFAQVLRETDLAKAATAIKEFKCRMTDSGMKKVKVHFSPGDVRVKLEATDWMLEEKWRCRATMAAVACDSDDSESDDEDCSGSDGDD